MMSLLYLLFIAAASSSKFPKEGAMPGGLCFDEGEVALACTAGTELGAKLGMAMESCAREENTTTTTTMDSKKEKPCRGRRCGNKVAKKCPSVEAIKKNMGEHMKDDLCILKKLGWIDDAGEAIEEVMSGDIMTLPTAVSAQLSEEKVSACAEKHASKMSKKMAKKHKKCAQKYSTEDVAQLKDLGMKAAGYKCFQRQFAKSCQGFVKEQIYDFYKAKIQSPQAA